jgi:hypothetical protein
LANFPYESVYSLFIAPIYPNIYSLPKWVNINKSIFPDTKCTQIVVWNKPHSIGSTLGLPKFTKYLKSITYIPSKILSIFVGLLLSDAGLSKQKKSINARLGFKQSIIHFSFFWTTFNKLSHYCSSIPYTDNGRIKGKLYFGIRFDTRAYPCFTTLFNMFYSYNSITNKWVKIVPLDIYNLLTPEALAYWIMGDGAGNKWKGLYLCTDSFSNYDVNRLINVLLIRYNIRSNFVIVSGKARIYIPSTESNKLINLVKDYIHPSMQYKILGKI